jgi:hypothetical protein
MSTFREAILPTLSAVDSIIGALDLAPTNLTIITRRWSSGTRREGTPGDEVLQIPDWTLIEEIGNREVAQSGGEYVMGDLRCGPIRPYFKGECCNGKPGGFTVEQLQPRAEDESTEIIYRVAQTHGLGTGWEGDYSLVALERQDPLEFFLIIRRSLEAQDPIPPIGL